MNKIKQTLVAGLLLAASIPMVQAEIAQPNIIVFYVDDLGWQDIQVNDVDAPCAYETPNMVKLAASGMNFTQGYSPAPTCSPSRAAIITGQHPAKTRFTHVTLDDRKVGKSTELLMAPYLEAQLDRNLLTSADALKANGYRTGHSGKWHIGLTSASYGFDTVNEGRGIHRSVPDRTKDFATANDPKFPLSVEKYPPYSEKKSQGISYPYDEVTESAIKFMQQSKDEPFFLNLCHWMVHWPMLTRNGELLEYYCDKFDQPFPPKVGDMTLPGQQNPYFASMVTSVDWSLGRIVDFLEKTDDPRSPGKKLIETTYIFFSSDNGGAEKRGPEVLSDNAPLKYGKGHTEGGGVRVPMVISGPGIAAGSQFDGLISQLDFFPTFLGLTDSEIAANDFAELSGLDIALVLHGQRDQVLDAEGNEREFLFWHFPHGSGWKSAIRSGDFKLHKRYETDDYELYQIYQDGQRNDFEEVNDLAQNPEYASVVERLSGLLDEALVANNAELPYLNPNYAEAAKSAAKLGTDTFKQSTRKAQLTIQSSGPMIKEASVIYCEAPTTGKTKKTRHKGRGAVSTEFISGMRFPAIVSEDGFSVSAVIPENIAGYCFMLIDANGFMQFSDVMATK
ncbi:MAG: sulfatase [Lentimonas sp.]